MFVRYLGRNHHKHSLWEVRCDCGTVKVVPTASKAQSCGCLRNEKAAERQRARALPPDVKRKRVLENRRRQRERRKSDPAKAMQARLSRLHRFALQRVGGIKKSPTFEELGYSVCEFVEHMERQFLPGMGWHNMDEWQIDHIIPVSSAVTVEDVIRLNQLPNLRPMWSADNNRKKDKRDSLL